VTKAKRHEKPCALPLSSNTCVYLADGSKVVIRRGPKVKGPVWLKVVPQDVLHLQEPDWKEAFVEQVENSANNKSVTVNAPPVCGKCYRLHHRGACHGSSDSSKKL
jgi:hypothetical protein